MKINRIRAKEILSEMKNGTIYSVTFVKKDGSLRVMNSIKGTSRGVKGVGLKYDAEDRGLVPVYDIQIAKKDPSSPEKAWSMVNISTITNVCVNKENFEVED